MRRHPMGLVALMLVAALLPGLATAPPRASALTGPSITGAATLDAGERHTCAVLSSALWCWGDNGSGQLGDGTTTWRLVPTAVPGASGVDAVTAGGHHTCVLLPAGAAACTGRNLHGQLGDGTTTNRSILAPVIWTAGSAALISISAGTNHTCGVDVSGTAWCWGQNLHGQLGDGTTTNRSTPTAVTIPGGRTVESLVAGTTHTCAVADDATAWCWGANTVGQLGDGTTTNRSSPTAVPLPAAAADVAAGATHSCARSTGGQAWCWGANSNGRLGDGTTTNRLTPSAVSLPGAVTLDRLVTGGQHTCALDGTGEAWCWGANLAGQVGDGTTVNRLEPVASAVPGEPPLTALTGGTSHTCAGHAGALWCWGANGHGQIGDGSTTLRALPVEVGDGTPPTITAAFEGTAGDDGWYRSDVTVSWVVTDDRSTPTACPATTVSEETSGEPVTCTATSLGGTSSASVTVKRDVTPPEVAVTGVVEGGQYAPGTVPAAGCSTTDGLAGVAVEATVSVSAPDPFGPGTRTATCSGGTDRAGNVAPPVAVTYVVNSGPTLSALSDRTIVAGSSTGPLTFVVGEDDHLPSALTVTATASVGWLVPPEGLVVTGAGAERTLTVTPAPGATGATTITLTVTDPAGASTSRSFTLTVTIEPPAITALSSTAGLVDGGLTLTIRGSRFTGVTGVRFGPTPAASFQVVDDTTIVAVTPARPSGLVNVWVDSPRGANANLPSSHFVFQAAPTTAPSVTSITPNGGTVEGGTTVTILGKGFLSATAVRFGPSSWASFTVVHDGRIVATTPPRPAGLVNVWVTNPHGTSTNSAASWFTYRVITGPPPTVTSVSPGTGPPAGGTTITITGTGFTGATSVELGPTPATSFTVHSDTLIEAVTPARPTGLVNVWVRTNNGASANTAASWFRYG